MKGAGSLSNENYRRQAKSYVKAETLSVDVGKSVCHSVWLASALAVHTQGACEEPRPRADCAGRSLIKVGSSKIRQLAFSLDAATLYHLCWCFSLAGLLLIVVIAFLFAHFITYFFFHGHTCIFVKMRKLFEGCVFDFVENFP